MGEVLCVATWNEKKEKQLTQWVSAKADRYVVWVVDQKVSSHPRMYQAVDNDLAFRQIALELLYLSFVYEDPSHPALQKLARIQTELHLRSSDFLDQGVKLLANYRAHLQDPFFLAEECSGKMHSFPAVVCGAGPSLKQAIPLLKKYPDRFLILGCGAGLQALLSAGVQPHLAVQVDPDPGHRFSKASIPLFFQLRTTHHVTSQLRGPHFLMAGAGDFSIEKWIEEKIGLVSISDGGWTAATRGTALAQALGCKAIYFAGIDFTSSSRETYAKGVKTPAAGSLMKVTLSDGSIVETRSDWLLGAEWLNTWVLNHSEQKWGIVSKDNPLMPAIPAVDLETCLGPEGVSVSVKDIFSACQPKDGREIWGEIANSFKVCRTLVDQFLTRLQAIFPQSPLQDEKCLQVLQDLDAQLTVQKILNPIWDHWEFVLRRQPENHPAALVVHRVLLLKSLADKFYV